jgi:glycosyltransferase involved in cell wall biosynthesis
MSRLGEGYAPVFVTKEQGPVAEWAARLGIRHHLVQKRGFLGLSFIRSFLRIIGEEDVRLVHLNTLTPFCKYAAIAAYLRRIPIVWFVRENPGISRSRRLARWMRQLASKIVFVDGDTRKRLMGDGRAADVSVVYNGVDLAAFAPGESGFLRERFSLGPESRVIGYVGLITRRKGIEYLIQAFDLVRKGYPEARLVIIGGHRTGEEDYLAELKALISSRSLDGNILFTGPLADVREALHSLDIVVLPSLEERCSRTLIESLACGKAVVATRVGGTPEIIEHDRSGLLVDPRNAVSLAAEMQRLLGDDDFREGIARVGRSRAEMLFDINANIEKVREVYRAAGGRR